MKVQFQKKFETYRDATIWMHQRGYQSAVVRHDLGDTCTITIEGEDAKRAIEEATNAKIIEPEAA